VVEQHLAAASPGDPIEISLRHDAVKAAQR
jgi:hypothetical protein